MTDDTVLDEKYTIRLNSGDKRKFMAACKRVGMPPQSTLRQIMIAFSKRRLKILTSDKTLKLMQETFTDAN